MSQQERVERLQSITKEAFGYDGAYCGTTVKDLRWILDEFKEALDLLTKEREAKVKRIAKLLAIETVASQALNSGEYTRMSLALAAIGMSVKSIVEEGDEPNETQTEL